MSSGYFSTLIGNEEVKKNLMGMLSKQAIGHALLFAGSEGIGKSLFARALAACLLANGDESGDESKNHMHRIEAGQHPDLHVYRPEGKMGLHSILSLRQLSEEVQFPPYETGRKVFIIHEADRMLSYSANALLKTFEEPPPRTVLILLSRSQAVLLPTILSRCCTLHFRPIEQVLVQNFLKQRYALDEAASAKIARQAQGSFGRAVRLVEQGDSHRTHLLNILSEGSFGNYRSLQEHIQTLGEQLEVAKKQAEEAARKELGKGLFGQQLSAHQQHALEKELEGLTALALAQEAQMLFEVILSWYRDMQLLALGGNAACLIHSDFQPHLEQAIQRGDFKPLPQVLQFVEEAYLALQRSTPLTFCLENLFLKLDYAA